MSLFQKGFAEAARRINKAELESLAESGQPIRASIRLRQGTSESDISDILRSIAQYATVLQEPMTINRNIIVMVSIQGASNGRKLIDYCDRNKNVASYQPSGETRGEYSPNLEYCFG